MLLQLVLPGRVASLGLYQCDPLYRRRLPGDIRDVMSDRAEVVLVPPPDVFPARCGSYLGRFLRGLSSRRRLASSLPGEHDGNNSRDSGDRSEDNRRYNHRRQLPGE
jgi:hypothetical protein